MIWCFLPFDISNIRWPSCSVDTTTYQSRMDEVETVCCEREGQIDVVEIYEFALAQDIAYSLAAKCRRRRKSPGSRMTTAAMIASAMHLKH